MASIFCQALLDNISRSEMIQEVLDKTPNAHIDPYDEDAWSIDEEKTLDFLNIPKRASIYKVANASGAPAQKPIPSSSKPQRKATVTSPAKTTPGKAKPSVAKGGLQKKGAARGAKKLDALKRVHETEEPDDDDDEDEEDVQASGDEVCIFPFLTSFY
jgi:hypothetical protein